MLNKIKKRLNQELTAFPAGINKEYQLRKNNPLLFQAIKEFVRRPGKRLRPLLFITAYRGFAKKDAAGLYQSALAWELLHDFLLIHDDIIDKSATRRGKPALHKVFTGYLARAKNVKFNGQDLALVAGDVLFALAVKTFLGVKASPRRKQEALETFMTAASYAGCGEFIELLAGLKDIKEVTQQDIYRIYDYKTSSYSFSCPLTSGAQLAGAGSEEIKRLEAYGLARGKAFQIKDDILGLFAPEKQTGKCGLSDLQEAKKTILVWYAFQHSAKSGQGLIKKILGKKRVTKKDLRVMRKITIQSGALDYAQKQVQTLTQKAKQTILPSKMKRPYKQILEDFRFD